MIPRNIKTVLYNLSKGYPVIAVTGPRQAGKTTLTKSVFSDKPYVTFEDPDIREFSERDPRGFLKDYRATGAVFDEIQRSPDLFSYLQGIVDEDQKPGHFILTGSQQFNLMSRITQSLAGRIALVQLLPFSYHELYSQEPFSNDSGNLDHVLFTGLYPPIHDKELDPQMWCSNYIQTYVERDVRQMVNVKDLGSFQRFIRLCAGRAGQLLNLSNLATECGITQNTAKAWISILEASYIVFLLQPHHANFNKRIIKTPKLYFYDTGILSWLLSIRTPEQLSVHPMRGAIFESYIVSEFMKYTFHKGYRGDYYFWRDRSGNEIDLLSEEGHTLRPYEIKSGQTVTRDFFKGLKKWLTISDRPSVDPTLIYGGDGSTVQNGIRVISWKDKALFP